MIRAVESASGAARRSAAAEFIESFAPSDDLLIVGASRGAVDDLVRCIASGRAATFGWRRTTPLLCAVEIAAAKLAHAGLAPATPLGLQALTMRAIFEARRAGALRYFDLVVESPGFPAALAGTLPGASPCRHQPRRAAPRQRSIGRDCHTTDRIHSAVRRRGRG